MNMRNAMHGALQSHPHPRGATRRQARVASAAQSSALRIPASRPLEGEGVRASSLTEFELIARYFTRPIAGNHSFIGQGIGDDCAILTLGERGLAITTDMLIEGTHFLSDADAHALGHKSLAVNLSDLAAAGAKPACFFLALALPRVDETWLAQFSAGLFALADEVGCVLAGGDTTRAPQIRQADGPITVCITAVGEVPTGQAHSRARAVAGDDLWVSAELGGAALALQMRRGVLQLSEADAQACQQRMDRPQPRVVLGQALRGIAHAAIDISDGLLADLGHICERSEVGATVQWEGLPRVAALATQPLALQHACALAGGDDYELLFTAPVQARAQVEAAAREARTPVTRIGVITHGREVVVVGSKGERIQMTASGFDHFA